MKTIEQLQNELRAFAEEMNGALEQMKEKTAEENGFNADFEQISANACRYPIEGHPMANEDEHSKKCYITMLLSVVRYEPKMLSESLLYAHRVAFGMGYLSRGENLKDEFLSAQTLTFAQLDEITVLFKDNDLRLMLIEECLIMAGAFDKNKSDAFNYIAEIAVMLNVNKKQLTFLGNMAAVILTRDMSNYKCDVANKYSMFDCYLKDICPLEKRFEMLSINADCQKARDAYSNIPQRGLFRSGFKGIVIKSSGYEVKYYMDSYDNNEILFDSVKQCAIIFRIRICDNDYQSDQTTQYTSSTAFYKPSTWGKSHTSYERISLSLCLGNTVPISELEKAFSSLKIGVKPHPLYYYDEQHAREYYIAHGGIVTED